MILIKKNNYLKLKLKNVATVGGARNFDGGAKICFGWLSPPPPTPSLITPMIVYLIIYITSDDLSITSFYLINCM